MSETIRARVKGGVLARFSHQFLGTGFEDT